MSVKFTVKMTEKYMYDFFLYNAYTSISGLLGPILGVVALMMAINSYLDAGVTAAMPGLLVAILFLIISPIQLKSRAKMQVQQSEMFKKPAPLRQAFFIYLSDYQYPISRFHICLCRYSWLHTEQYRRP